uniref:Si:ch211-255i20.3 n=1 Tax=Cyprinus carpio carpio TaxID=630221 RepID=A0A8C1BYB0_CYPCA
MNCFTAMYMRLTGLLLASCVILAPAMYFDLGEQEEKCIIEEIPEDTLVSGVFLLEYWDENKKANIPHLGLTVTVRDPNHAVVLLKRFGRYGKFTFKSDASGQHFLCMQSNSTRFSVFAGDRLKVHLDVQMGEHTIDPNAAKAKDTMKTMEYSLQHLIDQMRYISRQQNFQRVLQFQARHQKRLLAHYQQKIERMKEDGQKMQQEMQKMSKKISEQNAYISKLEMTVQNQSSRLALQSNRDLQSTSQRQASPVTKIPYSSPLSMSRTLSSASLADSIEINSRGHTHKPEVLNRICLRSSPKDCRIGSVLHRASSQSSMGSHSTPFSATVSREFSIGLREPVINPSHNVAYRRESAWETPVFKLPSAYKYGSVSSLGPPP